MSTTYVSEVHNARNKFAHTSKKQVHVHVANSAMYTCTSMSIHEQITSVRQAAGHSVCPSASAS